MKSKFLLDFYPRTGKLHAHSFTFTYSVTITMVVIRLRREGTKNRPFYRIVAADQRFRRDGRFLEILGTYDPLKGKDNAEVDVEKANAWIAKGAQPTETVRSILKKAVAAAPKA
jgi:small subunit ribosomal protein S16